MRKKNELSVAVNKGGQPRKFSTEDDFFEIYLKYMDDIAENGFQSAPTLTAFSRWCSQNYKDVDRRTIYNTIHQYFPEIRKRAEEIRADVLVEGGLLRKYSDGMTRFALANYCGWKDKPEIQEEVIEIDFGGDEE